MKVLLCHVKNFRTEIKGLANTPVGIVCEPVGEKIMEDKNTIVALITVEVGDDLKKSKESLASDVQIFCKDTGHDHVVIFPFGHLSNNLADSKTTIEFLDMLQAELSKSQLSVKRAHFGSHKKLLLDIFGHKGNVRYREYLNA